jgi:hypothetical protein
MLGNVPDYSSLSFEGVVIESKLPNIRNVLIRVKQLKNALILQQEDKNYSAVVPAPLHYLTDSVIQSLNIIDNLKILVSNYDKGTINREQLRRKLRIYIHNFKYEKYHIFESLNSEFLK